MKIFSNEQMKGVLDDTLRERGISMLQMSDSIGAKMAQSIKTLLSPKEQRIIVFAGPEQNGVYALATARHLYKDGLRPEVYLFNVGGNRATADCVAMRDLLLAQTEPSILNEITSMQFTMPRIGRNMVFVDGLFGTERTNPLPGGYQSIVRYINELGVKVFSLEVPSGLLVDSMEGLINRNIVHATYTLTIGEPGLQFFLKDNEELIGQWHVIDPGFSKDALAKATTKYTMIEPGIVRRLIKPRSMFASKADCGDAIIYAGSYGMLGAAVLCSRAAIRAGAGKVTVHSPRCGFHTLQSSVPCALYEGDPGDVAISQIELRHDYNAVAIGPGIGTADVTIDALDSFLKIANANSRPVVLDADALNCISYRKSMLNHLPVMSIITPHQAEFDRLFDNQPSSYARLMKAINEAKRRQIFIILKGRYTAIVWPDGKVYFNPTGGPELATAGTGDVLTGIIAALLAQGMPPERASIAAPFIHGLAGEIAADTHSQYSVTAEDVIENIGRAIKSLID